MGRTRRSTNYGYSRRAPYNLRSRSKVNYNFMDSISADDATAAKSKELVKVEKLDACREQNAVEHHTEDYEVDYVVLRRGQAFDFNLRMSRALKDDEKVLVILTTGRTPYPSKGTLLSFKLREKQKIFGWSMESSSSDQQEFKLTFNSPADAIIGKYHVTVQISSPAAIKTSQLKESFCLIFNPWSTDDDVYLEGKDLKEEYVLNPSGRVWVGTKNNHYGRPWSFGQFEACSLEAALYILDISELPDAALSNAVTISRTFSKMSNSFDDDGIIAGNWSGDYSGGVEPTDWVSSVDILEQYMETKEEVKYGQCWVFSAVITTLLRAVGIPGRSVTNFESAHDNDRSMTIDRHWNWDDKPLTDLNDSIWNFHVWNEAWFKRPDLPDGHDGWQAIDGTPQENSEGVMQCGPASIKAIKDGEVYLPYDAKFIIAEVNGDIIEWVRQKSGEMVPVYKETASVGFNISTKAVGSSDREDVTGHYKYKEGSAMERKVAASITKFSSRKDELMAIYDGVDRKGVAFNLSGEGYANGDVKIQLDMKSESSKDVTVSVTITCNGSYYNGVTSEELKVETQQVKLKGRESTAVLVKLAGEEYLNKIATDAMVSVYCKAKVLETQQQFFKKETFTIDRPDVIVDTKRSVEVNGEFPVDISFTNTLSIPLTDCRLSIHGPGVQAVRAVKLFKSVIDAGETINQTFTFRARVAGVKEIVALLHTRQLQNVTGSTTIKVIK